jgi:hypothetical protein
MTTIGTVLWDSIGAHALHELEPVHDGHVHVREDDIELVRGELAQPVHAVDRFDDAGARTRESAKTSSWRIIGESSTTSSARGRSSGARE